MCVILAAHGAGDGSEANRGVVELADSLRRRRPGVRFECAFWKGRPTFRQAARSLRGQSAVVVPIMASDGYYARFRLPEEWAKGDPSHSWVIAPPIGTLPTFSRVLETRVGDALAGMNRRGHDPIVLLVGHGTTRVRFSGDTTRRIRGELAAAFPRTEIVASFLDESPHITEVARSLGDRPVVVAPLLLGGAPHVLIDIAKALDEPRREKAGWAIDAQTILPSILKWPELASLVLEALDIVTGPASGRETLDSVRSPVTVGAAYATVP
jgi:sirohydrochlorin ferrochelatase